MRLTERQFNQISICRPASELFPCRMCEASQTIDIYIGQSPFISENIDVLLKILGVNLIKNNLGQVLFKKNPFRQFAQGG